MVSSYRFESIVMSRSLQESCRCSDFRLRILDEEHVEGFPKERLLALALLCSKNLELPMH